ncbi:MAG: cell wall-binding repeat-containing protein [Firmicutes bacterium]|nr:cell wall-binding repeat-containing protein [Alicyclobacillaceae bacterium]MCL6496274.1 cell wall-binding repeat-containing protein [Bacillota bacterium]
MRGFLRSRPARIFAAVLVGIAPLAPAVPAASAPFPAWPTRLAGPTRAATAVAVATAEFPDGVPSHRALLVSGATPDLVDALVAGPLAFDWHVPILLTDSPSSLNPSTLSGLRELGVTQVVPLGADNTPAMTAAIEAAGFSAAPGIGGQNPVATAAAVAAALSQATGQATFPTVFVASDAPASLVDALSSGPAAAEAQAPILLVPPPTDGTTALPAEEARWVRGTATAYLLGAVGHATLTGMPPGVQQVALAGQDRFGTSARVAAQGFPQPEGLFVADGLPHHFSDAVTAAPLAARWHAPIVLVAGGTVPDALVRRYLGRLSPTLPIVTLGGTAAIPAGDTRRVQDALGSARSPIVRLPTAVPQLPDPRFGVANAQDNPSEAVALGAGWSRIPFFWNDLEPKPGVFNAFATDGDAPERALAASGVHLVGVIEGAPTWAEASPKPGVETAPKGLDLPWNAPGNLWGQFVYHLAKHYEGLINTWIIGNEISIPQGPYATWGGTVPEFARLIAVAYAAIHAANPAAHVLGPATPYWYARGKVTAALLQALAALPGAQAHHDFLDGLDVNLYNTIEYNPMIYATYAALLQSAGLQGLPVWLTETNVAPASAANPKGADPIEQASFLVEMLATSFQWVTRAEAYQLEDSGGDSYGLFTAQGTPRLEATAFHTLVAALTGATWLHNQLWTWKRGYPTPSTPAIATWGAPGRLIQVVWDQGFHPTVVHLVALAPTATVTDLTGHTTTIRAKGGTFTLALKPATYDATSFQAAIGGPPLLVTQTVAPGQAGTPTQWAAQDQWPYPSNAAWQPGAPVPWSVRRGAIAVAVNPAASQVVIQDGPARHWVHSPGEGPLSLSHPVAAAVGPNGWVYVANLGHHDILAYLPNGRLIAAFGGYGTGPGELLGPSGIAVAPDGTVYVADAGQEAVVAYSPSGRFLRRWGQGGSQPGQFDGPSQVAVGPHGTVYVADTLNGRVEAFSPTGTLLGTAAAPWPVALTVTGPGALAVVDGMTGASVAATVTPAS